MSLWYTALYHLGLTPWEADPTHGTTADQVSTLLDREEEGRELPNRRALDLGCGSGIWSVELARRGWDVTGVDVVPKAVHLARERAETARVDARFVEGDVADLEAADIGSNYQFVLDFECFNHLDASQREAVGQGINSTTAQDATMLMLVWAPGKRGPLPPGADPRDIEMAFPNWMIVADESFADQASLPFWLKGANPHFYRLRRKE